MQDMDESDTKSNLVKVAKMALLAKNHIKENPGISRDQIIAWMDETYNEDKTQMRRTYDVLNIL